MLQTAATHTVVGSFTVSTVGFLSDEPFAGISGITYETCVFNADWSEGTDPMVHPRHRRDNGLNGFNSQIATIGHELTCYRLRAGMDMWDASHVTKDDILRHIRMTAED